MKRFFLIGIFMLFCALLATVVVWYVLQGTIPVDMQDVVPAPMDTPSVPSGEESASSTEETGPIADPIPLRDLPLSDNQRSMLETAGIDVETFVITPEMATCARDTLGTERFDAIVAGAAPSLLESTRLLGCIR